MYNIETFYKARNNVIKLFDDSCTVASDSTFKATHGKGLKIVTQKQMLQRIPIALAQLKVEDTFENILNKVCQIIYLLSQAKEMTKKIYANIMNSVKL